MVLVPALLMVSTIRFRSFKTIDLQTRRPFRVLLLIAGGIMLIAWLHRYVLVIMAYSYLASAFVGMAITRFRHRGGRCRCHGGRPIGPKGPGTERDMRDLEAAEGQQPVRLMAGAEREFYFQPYLMLY